jgi:hypothetical protein
VVIRFSGAERDRSLAFLVTPNLDGRGCGLLALRAIMDHIVIETVGRVIHRPPGEPENLPDLILDHR